MNFIKFQSFCINFIFFFLLKSHGIACFEKMGQKGTHFHLQGFHVFMKKSFSTLSFRVCNFVRTDYCYFGRDNRPPNVSLIMTFVKRFYYTIDTSTF